MSSELEFKGKTVEKAVAAACRKLDLKTEDLKYEIVTYGTTGIFGLVGLKKAVIRVKNKEKQLHSLKEAPGDRPVDGGAPPLRSMNTSFDIAADAGTEALQKIVDGITSGARVITEKNGKHIFYSIEGGKAGVIIGKRGQTLDSLQYLVEKIVNRKSKERARVKIDVGGYLENKKQNLENLAERTAQKAKNNGKPATIGQLNAHDRRIIHLALKKDREVITKSVGKGYLRKLVVLPKKSRGGPRRRQPKT